MVTTDGSVHQLLIGEGTFTKVAQSRAAFTQKRDENGNANDWLMIPLVDQLVAAGIILEHGQCYGFKVPPILGGEYTFRIAFRFRSLIIWARMVQSTINREACQTERKLF
jgi:hypothetical protein